jgi:hypothetical protein
MYKDKSKKNKLRLALEKIIIKIDKMMKIKDLFKIPVLV